VRRQSVMACAELQACGGGGGTSGVGYVETVDAGRRHPLQDTAAALVPWRPAVIHAQSPAAGVVDEQAPSASGMSSSSAADCGGVEDGLNRTVEELGTTADDCECECEHIDVDTVDDSSPQLSATIAAAETSPLPSSLSSSPSATAASALSATVAVEDLGMSSLGRPIMCSVVMIRSFVSTPKRSDLRFLPRSYTRAVLVLLVRHVHAALMYIIAVSGRTLYRYIC